MLKKWVHETFLHPSMKAACVIIHCHESAGSLTKPCATHGNIHGRLPSESQTELCMKGSLQDKNGVSVTQIAGT